MVTMDEDYMSPPPSYSSRISDQIDIRARGNTRRKEYDGKSDDMDSDHLLLAVAN